MDAKTFLTPRRVIGGIGGAVVLYKLASALRPGSGGDLPAAVPGSLQDLAAEAPAGARSLRGLGVLAATATVALALPAYRKLSAARGAADAE